jgi:hypothetical protein
MIRLEIAPPAIPTHRVCPDGRSDRPDKPQLSSGRYAHGAPAPRVADDPGHGRPARGTAKGAYLTAEDSSGGLAMDDEQWFTDETSEHPDQPLPPPRPEEDSEPGMLEKAACEIRAREEELRKALEER